MINDVDKRGLNGESYTTFPDLKPVALPSSVITYPSGISGTFYQGWYYPATNEVYVEFSWSQTAASGTVIATIDQDYIWDSSLSGNIVGNTGYYTIDGLRYVLCATLDADGKIHCSYGAGANATGRFCLRFVRK